MNLAIVGTGLVSPIGLTPLHHACFPRAGIGLRPATAFVGRDGEPVPAFHCPWLGAKLPVAERLFVLAEHALQAASEPLAQIPHDETALFLCLGPARAGLVEADRQGAVGAITKSIKAPLRRVLTGSASVFAALGAADVLLSAGEVRAVLVAAVDSFVSLEAVRAELETSPAAWVREPPPPSEAAAAVALMRGADARELGVSLGSVHYTGTLKGQGSDDDDEIVDGRALAALVGQIPAVGDPLVRAYGQEEVDRLRQTEWTCAAARNVERFHPLLTSASVETWTGRIGGAAGAASLVYGLAAERHHAMQEDQAGAGPIVAWAISRDGTRVSLRRHGGRNRSMSMEAHDRIRRVEAIPMRPCLRAGEVAMLRRPSLVAFSGPCERTERRGPLAENGADDDLSDVEPDLARPRPDELRLDEAHAAATRVEDFTAGIVAGAADTMAMLAEHRATRPMSLRPSREARILKLVDAVFATGERAVTDILGWWESAREVAGPWAIWPAVFVLGVIDGPDGLLTIERVVESLGPEEAAAVQIAADALAVVPHPGVNALADDLLEAENPVARAIGVEVLSRQGKFDGERLARLLDGQAPALLAASLRALVRVEDAPPAIDRVLPLLLHPDPEVAWEAARAVTLWGAPDALRAVRDGHPLAATLGARAAELFVMAGEADDIAHLEALLARSPLTPELLDAIGRFGNPLAWSFVLHFLIDRDLCEAAEGALLTLFGPLVPPEATRSPSVWRHALAERDLDPSARYRNGKPWTPALVVNDCAHTGLPHIYGARSQRTIERWLDELAARTGTPMNVDLAFWTPGGGAKLLATIESAPSARWHPGAWNGRGAYADRRGT